MTDRRPLLRAIFDAAVAAAHPDVVLSAHLRAAPKGKVICLAAGKGAAAMAAAAERHYLDTLGLDPSRLTGLATTRHGHGVPTRQIRVVEAGHPVPDEAGLKAADETLRLAAEATADDLLLVLLSGGGSANWIAPADGVSFAQKQQVNRALLRSGAPIGEMNIVRKHLSRIKGGRLARAGQRAAEIVTLAISDVPHDDPSAIASGPTVPDPSTLAAARALVARYNLTVDDAVRRALEDPRNESCKPGDGAFARAQFEMIAKPKASLDAAIKVAKDAGYEVIGLGADLEGEARDVAADHARLALKAQSEGNASRSFRAGTHGDRARQWPWRAQPGICAGAGGPSEGHLRHCGAGRRHRRRRWRRRQRNRSGRCRDRQATFAKMKSLGLSPRPISPTTTPPRSFPPPAICC